MSASYRPRPRLPRVVRARCHVLLDFDGTIAPDDPTDRLLERFADPSWRDIEADWQAGKISSHECMEQHAALLRATPEELDAAIQTFRIDPAFPAFVDFCRHRSIDLTIVSDGFDRVLRAVLEREQVSVRFFANRLDWQGGDRWKLGFPYAQPECRSRGGNCKCSHGVGRRGPCVVIGDGRSDFCMAQRADYVIAKAALLDFCRQRALPHASFSTFDDVTARLGEWLSSRSRSASSRPSPVREELLGRRT